jgi:Asp-tRNA(Asn)/Glu-tRNA(Gln) amidotransferase A subunit family amidase
MAELHRSTVDQIAAAFAARKLSAVEYVAELLQRHRQASHLNAFYYLDEEQLHRDAVRSDERRAAGLIGALEGIPVAIKDNIGVASVPNTAGTPALRSHCPILHAPVVQKLIDAGALIFGKTAMDELAFGSTCNNAAFGATHNPVDPERIPGGSSGGSAVAVAAGITPLALGTDTGGSVRVPAALCGVCGFRPSVGRYSTQGIVPLSNTRDTSGPMARSMRDLALIDSVISGDADVLRPLDRKSLRLGLPQEYFQAHLDPEVDRLFGEAIARLEQAGVTIVEASVPSVEELNEAAGFSITLYETGIQLDQYLRHHNVNLSFRELAEQAATPNVRRILTGTFGELSVSDAQYQKAVHEFRPALQESLASYLRQNRLDAFIIPTVPLPAARIADGDQVSISGITFPTFEVYIRNTSPGTVAGSPGLTMPIGLTCDLLPVGLGLEGHSNSDRRLLAIGLTLEAILSASRPQ